MVLSSQSTRLLPLQVPHASEWLLMSSTLNGCLKTLPWNKPIELLDHHQWKHVNSPALLEWIIKARPYNTTVANAMSFFIFLFTTIFFGWMGEIFNPSSAKSTAIGIPFYILAMTAIYGTTHQKTKFAYRLTEKDISRSANGKLLAKVGWSPWNGWRSSRLSPCYSSSHLTHQLYGLHSSDQVAWGCFTWGWPTSVSFKRCIPNIIIATMSERVTKG